MHWIDDQDLTSPHPLVQFASEVVDGSTVGKKNTELNGGVECSGGGWGMGMGVGGQKYITIGWHRFSLNARLGIQ